MYRHKIAASGVHNQRRAVLQHPARALSRAFYGGAFHSGISARIMRCAGDATHTHITVDKGQSCRGVENRWDTRIYTYTNKNALGAGEESTARAFAYSTSTHTRTNVYLLVYIHILFFPIYSALLYTPRARLTFVSRAFSLASVVV